MEVTAPDRSTILKSPLNAWDIQPAHTEREHYYTIDGELVPSVTTVLKVLDKPALVPWAASQTAKKTLEILAKKTDANGSILMTFSEAQEAVEEAKRKYRETSSDARDIGTIVHAAVEAILLGKTPDPILEEGVRNGITAYTQWYEQSKVKPVRLEACIGSKKYRFGGTVDFVGFIDDKLVVADWKTSTGIYEEYKIQVAAYIAAVEEMLADKKQKFAGAYLLRFDKKTGEFNPKKDCVYVTRAEALKYFKAFKGLLVYYYAMKSLKA